MSDRFGRLGFSLIVILTVCFTFPGMSIPVAASSSPQFPSPSVEYMQDDELPGAFDPDDDDDGTTDSDDPDPLDPEVAPEPTPGTIDSGADSDNDELPNIQDPDDDQDGMVDEEDPAPFVPAPETPTPPAPTEEPAPSGGTTPKPETPSGAGATQDVQSPVALALPSTGAGTNQTQLPEGTEGVLMIATALVVGMGAARLAWQRR